jgi:hypothetical protein
MRALIFAAVTLLPALAWGQSETGSTGGAIGKTGREESGGREEQQEKSAAPGQGERRAPTGQAKNRQKTFVNPTLNGVRVDRCLNFGSDCDEPAAAAWCRSKGLSRAVSWKVEPSPETIIQNGRTKCAFACDGFAQIVCE